MSAPPGSFVPPGVRPPGSMSMPGAPAGGIPGPFPGAGAFARPPGPGPQGMPAGVPPGMQPGQPGMPPGQPGMQPGQPGMPPGQPGMPPGPGFRPAFPGAAPSAPGVAPVRPPGPGGMMGAPPGPGFPQPGVQPMGIRPPGPGMPGMPGGPPGAPMGAPAAGPMFRPQGPAMGQPGPQPGMGLGMPPGPGGAPLGMPGMPSGPGGAPLGMPGMGGPPGAPGMVPGKPPGAPGMPPPPAPMGMARMPSGVPGAMPGFGAPPPQGMMAGMAPGMAPPPGAPGMMHPPPGAPGMMPPPPGGMGGPPMAGGYDPYGAQRLVEQFESLALGAGGPGQPEGVDPSQLPRPIGEAAATAFSAPPPFDAGNCHPDNMRLTVNCIPNSAALRARWAMPLGLVVRPMADEAKGREVPIVNLGSAGIVRCRRCRTYMNPFVQWIDGGRRFRCNVCAMLNEVPVEYFCNLDQDGRRKDLAERPELAVGTVEYVAPAEYMVRPPMPPVYFFLIDVTYPAVSSGMVGVVCKAIKQCLDHLPGDERTMVGFVTFDSSLHFYNLKSTLSQPQILVVTELDEPFVPLPDDLLVNLKESRTIIDALLDSLPSTVASNSTVESGMGPALQAAFMVMAHLGGKLLVFQSSPPSLGIGKIKNRDNPSLYGTEREATIRQADDPFYKRFAAECSRVQISVDLFSFSSQYVDLASLAAMPRYTCGEIYHYPGFNASRDEAKLGHEVFHNLTRPTAWEAVMRIRTSKGLRISSFHGHFFNRSTDLLALPTCDPDKSFAVQIAHEENMVPTNVGYVQCALLYTNSIGERRIRVHTLAMPVVAELAELYNGSDAAALACLNSKLGVEKLHASHLEETRQTMQQKLVALLKEYRLMNTATLRQPNRLIYPPTLRHLPLWTLGTMRSAAFRGGAREVTADERMVAMHWVMQASVDSFCLLAYPSIYAVHDPSGPWGMDANADTGEMPTAGGVILPPTCPASLPLLLESGAYLIDNGRLLVLWIGRMVAREWALDVLGRELQALDPANLKVEPSTGAPLSTRLNRLLAGLRAGRPLYQQCFVVRQGSPLEVHVMPYLVEDRMPAMPSYSDFMVTLHKGVLSK